MGEKHQETMDAELVGLAAAAFAWAAECICANQDREMRGVGMAYEGCHGPEIEALNKALKERELLPKEQTK